MPVGPLGHAPRRAVLPAVRDPVAARESKEAAWELAKFLCAPEQVLDDAQQERLRRGVAQLGDRDDPLSSARFRPELVETTRATRAFARGERPVTRFGMEVGNSIGDEIVRVLTGELTSSAALQEAERTVAALGHPD